VWDFNWYQNQWPWMTFSGMMAILLHYHTDFKANYCKNSNIIRTILTKKYRSGSQSVYNTYKLTRNSSGDEIANMNLVYDDIVHALQNTIHLYINSTTDWHGYVLEPRFTKFIEIMQYNGLYAIQGRSRSFKVTDFGTNRKLIYNFLLVINTNLPPIWHHFQVTADYWSNYR